MDVTRARPLDSHLRCPYCRDELAGGAERVECPGCATVHHRACLEELGRCTVMGCGTAAPGRVEEPDRAPPNETPFRRQVRQRIRERVQRIARDLFTPVPADSTPQSPGSTGEVGEAFWRAPRLPEPEVLARELGPGPTLIDSAFDASEAIAQDVRVFRRVLLLAFLISAACAVLVWLALSAGR